MSARRACCIPCIALGMRTMSFRICSLSMSVAHRIFFARGAVRPCCCAMRPVLCPGGQPSGYVAHRTISLTARGARCARVTALWRRCLCAASVPSRTAKIFGTRWLDVQHLSHALRIARRSHALRLVWLCVKCDVRVPCASRSVQRSCSKRSDSVTCCSEFARRPRLFLSHCASRRTRRDASMWPRCNICSMRVVPNAALMC